jgi:hypothetical protein
MTLMTLSPWPLLRCTGITSLLLLAGCTSIELAPWPAAVRDAGVSRPARVESKPTAAPNVGLAGPIPLSSGVAARFPEPNRSYTTPGLSPGRLTWTTQNELAAWLREQARQRQQTAPGQAAVLTIGRSQTGQALEALVLTSGAGTDAASLKATKRPTVLLLAQQHGDASASAEALLVIARELSQGALRPLLSGINVLILPRANPDGAAKAARLTENGFDMAQDHLLLETPEAQALAKLTRDYQPELVLEAQEYPTAGPLADALGGLPTADAWVSYATTANLPEFLTKAAEEWFRQPLLSALNAEGLSSEWPQRSVKTMAKADKTIAWGDLQADSSVNVNGLKNRISLTVASRGADLERNYLQRRVHTQVTAIASVLRSTAERSSELAQLIPYLDLEVTDQACQKDRVLQAQATPTSQTLPVLDPSTGSVKTLAFETQSARLLRSVRSRVSPCGYWLDATATQAVERLRMHGVKVMQVRDATAFLGDLYQARESSKSAPNVSSTVSVDLLRGVVDAPAGSYYVPLDQALGNLVFAALEPDTTNSYFSQALIDELNAVARVMALPTANLREVP